MAKEQIGRALLTIVCFLGILALSARLISWPLSDGMDRRATALSFKVGSDRSAFAPAAYGEDSQTAVDDDEDIFQSIKNIEKERRDKASEPARAAQVGTHFVCTEFLTIS